MSAANQLRQFLDREFSATNGAMPFERFMELALYAPDFGYYTRYIEGVGGRRSDFATSASISPVLGQAIASWLQKERKHHQFDPRWSIIETGAGDGSLADSVLDALGWRGKRKLNYHIVEISPPLRDAQEKTLRRHRKRIHWHSSIDDALSACEGKALLFSNELVDAFPARIFQWDASARKAHEVFVEYQAATGIRETLRPTEIPASNILPHIANFADGQRFEVHDSYRRWLAHWSSLLRQGSMLTIDYGAIDHQQLYAKRPRGTLRSYHRHQRREGPEIYQSFGRQDLTCDVNFADLQHWGKQLGWENVDLRNQASFFTNHLNAANLQQQRSTAFLVDEAGAGGAFQVLHQRRKPVPPTS